jgi:hypothetical protein
MRMQLQVVTVLSLLLCSDAALKWELHQDVNCYEDRGAVVPLRYVNDSVARSLDECKKICEASLPFDFVNNYNCSGITVQNVTTANGSHMRCWRRGRIQIQQCDKMTGYDTWTLTGTPEKYPVVNWTRSGAVSCFEGHGAKDLEVYKGVPLGRMSFPECKAMCNFLPDCEGIVVEFDESQVVVGNWPFPQCYRRSSIDLKSCVRGDQQAWALPFDTWVKVKSADAPSTRHSMMAEEHENAACSHLIGDNCTANNMCRLCLLDADTSRPPYYRQGCVSEVFADSFVADQGCESPSQDPCKAHTSAKDCHDNGCRYCHNTAGKITSNFCVAEVPGGIPGFCDDTLDHESDYKACAMIPDNLCDSTAVCGLCEFQVSPNSSHPEYDKLCVDKDTMGSWCKGNSRIQTVMI